MEGLEVSHIAYEAVWVIIKMSAPIMIIALVIGLCIALFQALTQIQETTLTFVPKIIAVFIGLWMFLSFMSNTLYDFTLKIFDAMVKLQ